MYSWIVFVEPDLISDQQDSGGPVIYVPVDWSLPREPCTLNPNTFILFYFEQGANDNLWTGSYWEH